ncbi:MAG: cyanophycinase [Pseudomonadota bacterium]
MLKKLSLVFAGMFAATLTSLTACAEPNADEPQTGSLIIAGGALARATEDVWRSFINSARTEGPVVIIPSASGSPVESAASARETLMTHGVPDSRIHVAKLAKLDDRSTPRVNEARWASNYDDPDTIALLESASAIWFTGGDQSRTTDLLIKDGTDTPALKAIRAASAKGTPIGGTSAGAAIMSERMLLQGDSLSALTGSREGESIKTGRGLGFFPYGLVDQHFGERARLGRLVAALAGEPDPAKRLGFGVDENTALIVSPQGKASVGGTGYITIVDARQATFTIVQNDRLKVTGLTLHLIAAGDTLDLTTLTLDPADWKKPTVGNEYIENPFPGGGGMALQGQMLADVIGEGLVDNESADTVDRISFDGTGRGVAYAFTQLPQSAGFWGRGPGGEGRYAIANVRFDIVPVNLTMETVQ